MDGTAVARTVASMAMRPVDTMRARSTGPRSDLSPTAADVLIEVLGEAVTLMAKSSLAATIPEGPRCGRAVLREPIDRHETVIARPNGGQRRSCLSMGTGPLSCQDRFDRPNQNPSMTLRLSKPPLPSAP